MSYAQPQVVSIDYNNNRTSANCEVRYARSSPSTPMPGHQSIGVTVFVPMSPGDDENAIKARAITMARTAIQDASQLP